MSTADDAAVAASAQLVDAGDADDVAAESSPTLVARADNDLVTPEPAAIAMNSGSGLDPADDAPSTKTMTTRRNCKGDRRRSKHLDAVINASARVLCATGVEGSDDPLPEESSEETVPTACLTADGPRLPAEAADNLGDLARCIRTFKPIADGRSVADLITHELLLAAGGALDSVLATEATAQAGVSACMISI